LTLMQRCVVEGLYRGDERDGPGLFSDVIAGHDDVGLWRRERLVKLCVAVPGVFVVYDHWPLSIDTDQHRLRVTTSLPPLPGHRAACPPPRGSDAHLLDARLPADSLAVDRQAFDDAFRAAVDKAPSRWRQRLREICVGS